MYPKHKITVRFYLKAKCYSLGLKCIYSIFLFSPLWPGLTFLPHPCNAPFSCAHLGDRAYTDEGCFSWLGLFPPSLPSLPSQSCVNRYSKAQRSRSSCLVSWPVAPPWWPSQTPPSHHPWSWLSTLSNQRH